MARWYNVNEALEVLKSYDITSSKQMVTRWLREGKIVGEVNVNRKEGWRIHENDLEDFIEKMRPGLKKLFFHNEELQNELQQLKGKLNKLEQGEQVVPIAEKNNVYEDWKLQVQSSQKQNELLLAQVESLMTENQKLREKNEVLQKDLCLLIEEKAQLFEEKRNLLLEKKFNNEINKEIIPNEKGMIQERESRNKTEDKLTLPDFKQALIKCSDSEWNEQKQKKLYDYFLKQIFTGDGELKEEMKGEGKKYYCNFRNKEYDKWMPFIKCKIKQFLNEGISDQILNETIKG
ncbi:helix-turn-helix domain-containing protein [Bacillus paranthracis]|uniref:helix-turn-helix domain-containing protein n=1 Tax=Bacillus cereus group TaxID=86661 RepID=UPI000BF2776C|nr:MULTISPECIES: helix-turn-helix domain-containing protein [Bacillus cereus group]MDA1510784.1 helix-turn-helix domain-containing protein [Bacillus cereus group sp. TH36-2LC]MDA1893390.1 helix-turn-helix domain-containing protein [Bacillus cereus group sp. BY11-1LC]MDA1901822.1 helix-turn-helix domain-containing protein [Bacillus cereus group sp. BcHK20]NOP82399.1 helix-turn-helix domain-containing protein [Bacillus paranthracis]PFU35551.1 DNA-binding protein [Bacillus cereus]